MSRSPKRIPKYARGRGKKTPLQLHLDLGQVRTQDLLIRGSSIFNQVTAHVRVVLTKFDLLANASISASFALFKRWLSIILFLRPNWTRFFETVRQWCTRIWGLTLQA